MNLEMYLSVLIIIANKQFFEVMCAWFIIEIWFYKYFTFISEVVAFK